ncbi:hypothetical protein C8R43DRAFT_1233989 [Mycena crocata]|nr:hypothetical protein C8R43DRAFT_1233989 [Mycena crocata]
MPRYRSNMCCAHAVPPPVVKRPKKILTEDEKEEAKLKRAANKVLRDNMKEWKTTLPAQWVEGATVFRHPYGTHVMFKSDAKKAFSLTETEILTLPHESIPGSFKTYFALTDAKALQRRKFDSGALSSVGVKGNLRVLRAMPDSGRRKKANFWEFHDGDAAQYERSFGPDARTIQRDMSSRAKAAC